MQNSTPSYVGRFRVRTARRLLQVLRGLNLDVEVGHTVALVGASGCGKSTTVALLQRFYDTVSGSVSVALRHRGAPLSEGDTQEMGVRAGEEERGRDALPPIGQQQLISSI